MARIVDRSKALLGEKGPLAAAPQALLVAE